MIDTETLAPCPNREHALVEMIEGGLAPDESLRLQAHLDTCARCRAWQAAYRAVDLGLDAALPRAAVSPDFERKLAGRIRGLEQQADRGALRGRARLEHDELLQGLRSSTWRALALNTLATVFTVIALWLLTGSMVERFPALLPGMTAGERQLAFEALGPALALAALAWTVTRGFMPRFNLRG